jgi:iron(III) transport system substrate-binding protein
MKNVFLRLMVAISFAIVLGMGAAQTLTLYSGRGEALVDPIIRQFERNTGITVNVRYGGTAELAVLIQEEGTASPADIYWAQDGGALGALSNAGLFANLPLELTAGLPAIYTNSKGDWIATSGRARVLAYSPERVSDDEIPASIFDLTDERYSGRVAWAPTNGSFQAFITAMRVTHGEERTREWLEGMMANNTQVYSNNTSQVEAIAAGEVDFALVNNYYLLRFLSNDPNYPVAQTFFDDEDIGNMVNVAGVGILATSRNYDIALQFVEFLLSNQAQQFFTGTVYEYPVTEGVIQNPALVDFETLLAVSPDIDLDTIDDLEGTLDLLREVGLL